MRVYILPKVIKSRQKKSKKYDWIRGVYIQNKNSTNTK